MAGKRRRSIVWVTFIRVLMFLSRLVWHSRAVNSGIDRPPPNRGSERAWRCVLRVRTFEYFNHSLLIIRSLSSFPTTRDQREAVNSDSTRNYSARKTWPRCRSEYHFSEMSHAVNSDFHSVIYISLMSQNSCRVTTKRFPTYTLRETTRKLPFQTIAQFTAWSSIDEPLCL